MLRASSPNPTGRPRSHRAPQLPQNRFENGTGLPQFAHGSTKATPQLRQRRLSLGFEAPHDEHTIGHRESSDGSAETYTPKYCGIKHHCAVPRIAERTPTRTSPGLDCAIIWAAVSAVGHFRKVPDSELVAGDSSRLSRLCVA